MLKFRDYAIFKFLPFSNLKPSKDSHLIYMLIQFYYKKYHYDIISMY